MSELIFNIVIFSLGNVTAVLVGGGSYLKKKRNQFNKKQNKDVNLTFVSVATLSFP
jgi:hypothetical protein